MGQLCCCIWECCLDLFGCWAKMHLDHAFLSTAGVRFSCTIRGSRLLLLPELCSCTAFERQNIEHMVRANYLLLQVVRTSERNHHVDRLCNLQLNKYSETASWSAADFICSVSVLLFRCSKECTKTVSAHPFSSQSDKGRTRGYSQNWFTGQLIGRTPLYLGVMVSCRSSEANDHQRI